MTAGASDKIFSQTFFWIPQRILDRNISIFEVINNLSWLWSYDMVGYLALHIVVHVPGSKQPFLEYEYRARRADKSLEQIIICLFNGLERRFGNR